MRVPTLAHFDRLTKPKRPAKLRAELNSIYPRWPCYVTDDVGTAHGGFWKGFRSPEAMWAWLAQHGYIEDAP